MSRFSAQQAASLIFRKGAKKREKPGFIAVFLADFREISLVLEKRRRRIRGELDKRGGDCDIGSPDGEGVGAARKEIHQQRQFTKAFGQILTFIY